MNIKRSIEVLSEPIGFDIAMSDDRSQANLINGLARGFKTMDKHNLDTQICYLVQHLTPEAKALIEKLNDYANGD